MAQAFHSSSLQLTANVISKKNIESHVKFKSETRFIIVLCLCVILIYIIPNEKKSENQIIFFDETRELLFVQELEESGVEYRKEHNSIWYDSNDKEKVYEVEEKVNAKVPVSFVVYDEKILAEFKRILDAKNINYEMKNVADGKEFLVSQEDWVVASEAVHYASTVLKKTYNK